MENNIVYTEDEVPVYNVFVEYLLCITEKEAIGKHFSQFGELRKVKLINGDTRRPQRKFIIQYKSAKAAGRALRERVQNVENQWCVVQPCPTWEQPFPADKPNKLTALNDYCLESLYQELDLKQQVNLSLVHSRLQQVFVRMICPRLPRHLNLDVLKNFTAWEVRQFFISAGNNFLSLEAAETYSTVAADFFRITCDSIKEHCPQISKLKIENCAQSLPRFLNALNPEVVTELVVHRLDIKDSDVSLMRNFPNLQSLHLFGSMRLRGYDLHHLKKVQYLSLCECANIELSSLLGCCEVRKLRYLDVRFTTIVSLLEWRIGYFQELETLKATITSFFSIAPIIVLPNLTSLELHFSNTMALPRCFFEDLAERHAHHLVELKLSGGWYLRNAPNAQHIASLQGLRVFSMEEGNSVTPMMPILQGISDLPELQELSLEGIEQIRDDDLYPIITKCLKLKRLNLRRCASITDHFVWRTLDILGRRETTEQVQLLIVLIFGNKVEEHIVQQRQYIENAHLLKLLFNNYKWKCGIKSEKSPFDISNELPNIPEID